MGWILWLLEDLISPANIVVCLSSSCLNASWCVLMDGTWIDGACGALFWLESKTALKFTGITKLLVYFTNFESKTCIRFQWHHRKYCVNGLWNLVYPCICVFWLRFTNMLLFVVYRLTSMFLYYSLFYLVRCFSCCDNTVSKFGINKVHLSICPSIC